MTSQSAVASRQRVLRDHYRRHPEAACIVKRTRTGPADGRDPFHGTVVPENFADPNAPYGVTWRYGIDQAVGGLHDAPNPAEMLCGALAACTDGTIRMVADLLGVELVELEVEVLGEVDVRGALAIDSSVRVGFQRLALAVRLRPAPGTSDRLVRQLAAAAESQCIVLDTLRGGVQVDVTFDCVAAGPSIAGARPKTPARAQVK
jgi:uncharacterized OsmC-like protein